MSLISNEFVLNVPKVDLTSPSSWGTREAVKGQLLNIVKKYGSFLKWSAKNSRIPVEVLASFIAVESGGNATAGGSGSVTQGLMQWNRDFADEFLEAENKLGRLTPEERDKLASFGIKFDANGQTRTITQADQIKPELNIVIGSILLGQYIDSMFDGGKTTKDSNGKKIEWARDKNGEMRLDKIIAVYNAGAYGDAGKKARTGNYPTALSFANDINATTSSYVKKMLGKNGALDISTSDLRAEFEKLS